MSRHDAPALSRMRSLLDVLIWTGVLLGAILIAGPLALGLFVWRRLAGHQFSR